MKIDAQDADGVTVLALNGRLTFGRECEDLTQAVRLMVSVNNSRILIDLSQLEYIDSCGVGALMAAAGTVTKAQGTLKLAAPQDAVQQVLDIVRISAVMEVYERRDAALASFADGTLRTSA